MPPDFENGSLQAQEDEVTGSGNLPKDMPDQPFLCFMDVFQQRGFVQAHLLCQFTGINSPGMIEKS